MNISSRVLLCAGAIGLGIGCAIVVFAQEVEGEEAAALPEFPNMWELLPQEVTSKLERTDWSVTSPAMALEKLDTLIRRGDPDGVNLFHSMIAYEYIKKMARDWGEGSDEDTYIYWAAASQDEFLSEEEYQERVRRQEEVDKRSDPDKPGRYPTYAQYQRDYKAHKKMADEAVEFALARGIRGVLDDFVEEKWKWDHEKWSQELAWENYGSLGQFVNHSQNVFAHYLLEYLSIHQPEGLSEIVRQIESLNEKYVSSYPDIISLLVGMARHRHVWEPMWSAVRRGTIPDAELQELFAYIRSREFPMDPVQNVRLSRLYIAVTYGDAFEFGDAGEAQQLRTLRGGNPIVRRAMDTIYIQNMVVFDYKYLISMVEFAFEPFEVRADDDLSLVFAYRHDLDDFIDREKPGFEFANLVYGHYSRVYAHYWSSVSLDRATQIMLGIELYRIQTGSLPSSLEDLVPQYFEELPIDPFSGTSLRYRTRGNRPPRGFDYDLYSVGADGEDNGGTYEGSHWDLGMNPKRPGNDIVYTDMATDPGWIYDTWPLEEKE